MKTIKCKCICGREWEMQPSPAYLSGSDVIVACAKCGELVYVSHSWLSKLVRWICNREYHKPEPTDDPRL